MREAVLILAITSWLAPGCTAQEAGFPVLTGPYLGQTPPGSDPEYFAPGIVSVEANFEHSAAVFSPDGTELFWCSNRNWYSDGQRDEFQQLLYSRLVDGRWTPPEVAPFARNVRSPIQRPVFSPDGNRLYIEFAKHPGAEDDADIYVVERTADGWSEPVPVSPLINTNAIERLHSVTGDGSLYFTRNLMTSDEAVYVSRFVDGAFAEPELLGESFNSEATEFAIVVAPDGDFMLTCQNTSPRTPSVVNVSYRREDGGWTERVSTDYPCGGFLALSPDGEYLFFLQEGILWVDTSFIEELRPGS